MKRRRRQHLSKLRTSAGRYRRGGGVTEGRLPTGGGKILILNRGRDAPLSPRGMNIFYAALFTIVALGMAALVWTKAA